MAQRLIWRQQLTQTWRLHKYLSPSYPRGRKVFQRCQTTNRHRDPPETLWRICCELFIGKYPTNQSRQDALSPQTLLSKTAQKQFCLTHLTLFGFTADQFICNRKKGKKRRLGAWKWCPADLQKRMECAVCGSLEPWPSYVTQGQLMVGFLK